MKNLLRFAICIPLILFTGKTKAQISGTVYLDINNNGTRTVAPATPFEPGLFGVQVRAYNSNGVLVASVTSSNTGAYSMPGVTSFPVRLEFTTDASQFSGKRPNANQSNVQFIAATTSTANYAVGYKTMYTNNPNPYIVTNAVVNGNPTGGGTSGTQHTLFVLPYSLTNSVTSFGGANYQNRWLGSVFGMTLQRETRTVLLAAYLKRHVGFGPGGIDAIYKTNIDLAGNATQPGVLFKLSNLGIDVGTDPRTVALPATSNSPNQDPGVFSQVGKRGIGNIDLAENGRDLFVTNLFQNKVHRINIGMPVKSVFSAADVTGNWDIPGPGLAGTEWHIMGIKFYNGKVYVGGVSSIQRSIAPVASAANLAADQVNLNGYIYELDPITGNVTQVMQFPFNYRRGHCNNDYRYEFKNNYWRAWQNNGDADILRADINTAYLPLSTATGNNTGIYYPQPMISDIELDTDGSMILAIRDRFADQSGYNNWLEGPNGTSTVGGGDNRTFRGVNSGEILRAGKSGSTWSIENTAVVTTNGVTTNSNNGGIQGIPPAGSSAIGGSWGGQTGSPFGWGAAAGQGYGPGGRYYYYNHASSTTGVPLANIQDGTIGTFTQHTVKANGGLAVMAGYDEVIMTAMDPDGVAFTSGLLRMVNKGEAIGTNAGNMCDQQQLLPWPVGTAPPGAPTPDPTTMGKSNGLGDVEVLFDAMNIEIGNRIWNDTNGDGVQDANEAGVGTITVLLRSPGADGIYGNADDQTWTTSTDANGNYYFDNTAGGGNVNDSRASTLGFTGLPAGNTGILNSQDYRIEIDPSQVNLTNYRITNTNVGGTTGDNIDNDGAQASLSGVGTRVYANVNTFTNDYNYDFGFKQLGAIGDKVWLDNGTGGGTASDGLQNGGEPGVAGISVSLFLNGTLLSTTVTDAYGNYFFDNLATGGANNYTVRFTPPANYVFTIQTNASADLGTDATGSDVNSSTGISYSFTLTTAEIERDIDAGLIFSQPSTNSIGDRVWLDSDGNNSQNGTEPGIAGVTVTLYNNSGAVVATTITDANGNYNFTVLPDGNYRVGFSLPAGFSFVTKGGDNSSGGAGDSGTDSDVNTTGVNNGKTDLIDLDAAGVIASGVNYINVDAGLRMNVSTTASIGDLIWNDLDQDGIQDAGEPGIAGVTVTLYASDGITVLATTVTDAFGYYIFTNLAGGTSYVIGITPPGGYTVSPQNVGSDLTDNDVNSGTNKTAAVFLPNGIRNLSVDAGLYQNAPVGTAKLGDRVWFDNGIGGGSAANGVQDGTEPGVAGVTVKLYQNGPDGLAGTSDDILIATTATDANGNYQFVSLAASAGASTEYNVGFSNLPPGYSFTPIWSSNDANATNSDANSGTGRTGAINLSVGENEQDVDAGLVAGQAAGKGSLGNKVFNDRNNNGIQNSGETGVAGVTVTLQYDLNNDGSFAGAELTYATQITNSLGEYLFTGLNEGNYRVVFSNGPAGYNIALSNTGTDDAIDSDGNNAGSAINSTASTTNTIYLGQGEDNLTVDLGIVKTSGVNGSISNQVWFDINSDGDRDANEPGLAGITVTLFNVTAGVDGIIGTADDIATASSVTTTDANGMYLFDNLAPTTATTRYMVEFTNYPAGLITTTQTITVTNDFSSGNIVGSTPYLILLSAENRTDVDFGLVSARASLGNFVWIDSNGDGVQDAGEPGVPGITILLYFDSNNDGDFLDAGENIPATSMITDQNGQYLFTNLNAGNYQVEFTTVPNGLNFTQQNSPGDNGNNTNSDANTAGRTGTINLVISEADLTVDAGLFKPTASVGNYVWADNDGNNVQSAADQGVAGVLVTLYTSGGVPVSTTVTDKNGYYLFTNVPPGNYYIGFTNTPGGVVFVTADQGGNDALDSDVNGANGAGTTVVFNVPQASVNITIDAGLVYLQTLPVQIQFTALKNNTVADLAWTVSEADHVQRYEVERSADNRNYTQLFSVTAGGNRFTRTDVSPANGFNYYRIKIINDNGSVKYSEVRIVIFNGKGTLSIFPNPAKDKVNIQLPESWQGKDINLKIVNQTGQVVINKLMQTASQVETIQLNNLPAGLYTLSLMTAEGTTENRKLKIYK